MSAELNGIEGGAMTRGDPPSHSKAVGRTLVSHKTESDGICILEYFASWRLRYLLIATSTESKKVCVG